MNMPWWWWKEHNDYVPFPFDLGANVFDITDPEDFCCVREQLWAIEMGLA